MCAQPLAFAEYATNRLREEILTGTLAPGAPLPLNELAERLGTSIMPVREALYRLQIDGLVEQVHQRGARVSALSIQDMEDTYTARVALETAAVRLACQRITKPGYEVLYRALDEFEAAYGRGDDDAGRDAHRRFHFGLYALSGSQWLLRLIPPPWENSERYRRLSITVRGTLHERRLEHEHILEAVYQRNEERAEHLLTDHLMRTLELVKGANAGEILK